MSEKSRTATCRQVNDLLDLLAADDLPVEQAGSLQEHLGFCPACHAEYERRRKSVAELRNDLTTAAQTGSVDLWPRMQEELAHRERRRLWGRWLQLEPARTLAAAAVLTVGLYVLLVFYPSGQPLTEANYPVYESAPVVVTAARIDHQSARVSGFESGDGNTVFLWLEKAQ